MSEETVHESERPRKRRSIASYLRRVADALGRGKRVPADEEQTVVVDPPAEPEFEVEVEREGDEVTLGIELEWDEADGGVETDVVASKATFELYEDEADEWRWRLVHDNGNVIADGGEGYASKQKAEQGVASVQKNAPGARVVDASREEDADAESDDLGSDATFDLYEGRDGWRWRLRHDNGNVIADGGQGYSSKQKAKQGIRSVQKNALGAPVETAD